MNICYVANSRFPSERAHMTQIVQMCNAFVQQGHEVTLLVTNRKTHIQESPEVYFGVPILFKVVRISVPDVAGVSHKIPSMLRPYLFTIQRLVFVYGSARYLKKNKCERVYGRDEWILWLLSFVLTTPITWESHEAKLSYVVRKLISRTRKIVAISEGIRDYYVRHGVAEADILVAHDAVDDRFFAPLPLQADVRKALDLAVSKPVALYVGGLETWKGADTLLEASLHQDVFEVCIIGGKPHEIDMYTRKYPYVHFLGNRPYKDLPANQQAGDVLIIPNTARTSLSAEYTSPLKLFTYMTAQKPIVASEIPSITNVMGEDDCFFFEADNPNSLRDAIIMSVSDEVLSMQKAKNVYEKSKKYTWRVRAGAILDFIQTNP